MFNVSIIVRTIDSLLFRSWAQIMKIVVHCFQKSKHVASSAPAHLIRPTTYLPCSNTKTRPEGLFIPFLRRTNTASQEQRNTIANIKSYRFVTQEKKRVFPCVTREQLLP